jgi:hypothetical protein
VLGILEREGGFTNCGQFEYSGNELAEIKPRQALTVCGTVKAGCHAERHPAEKILFYLRFRPADSFTTNFGMARAAINVFNRVKFGVLLIDRFQTFRVTVALSHKAILTSHAYTAPCCV